MDSVFFLDEADRANFIRQMLQSFGCTYICLWSYHPHPLNCLRYTGGLYHERNNDPRSSLSSSSSSATPSQMLFVQYGHSVVRADINLVPGLAFLSKKSYLELQSNDLQIRASSGIQRVFYQEARIKNAVFMGCNTGEIELGFSDGSSQFFQVNLEMEMRRWFSEDFSNRQFASAGDLSLQPNTDQNRPASSSSSLRSLSYDSSEYSPILLDIPSTSYLIPEQQQQQQQQQQGMLPTMASTNLQQLQPIQSLNQIRSVQLPSIESEDDAMTRAILAVISADPSSSSTGTSSLQLQQEQQNLHPDLPPVVGSRASAFRGYRPALAPRNIPATSLSRNRRVNMLKRSFAFLSDLYSIMRTQGQTTTQSGRTSSTQLHHMISERRRREKQNESFQRLRSLLPPGTKKDKATVLTSTFEYLKSLKQQVEELSRRNQILESQLLLPRKSAAVHQERTNIGSSSNDQRLEVQLTNVDASTSTSASRFVDLQVIVGGDIRVANLVIRLLEFLKTDRNLNLSSVEANTRFADTSTLLNNVTMRLRIEDGEWDESTFRETIRRVVNDMVEKPLAKRE